MAKAKKMAGGGGMKPMGAGAKTAEGTFTPGVDTNDKPISNKGVVPRAGGSGKAGKSKMPRSGAAPWK